MLDVRAVLEDLLAAAADQRAALEAGDRERLERVTHQQERLTARLENAERRRLAAMPSPSFDDCAKVLPGDEGARFRKVTGDIQRSVLRLQELHARNADLLQRSLAVNGQTLQFIRRLVGTPEPTYGAAAPAAAPQSLVVDRRA